MHETIEQFLNEPWNPEYPSDKYYIHVDVVYPEGSYPQLLFDQIEFDGFCKSLRKENSEIKRLVWCYCER